MKKNSQKRLFSKMLNGSKRARKRFEDLVKYRKERNYRLGRKQNENV